MKPQLLFTNLFLSGENAGSIVKTSWDSLGNIPGGKFIFSKIVGRAAPYTSTIGAVVEELSVGSAIVRLKDRKAVRNHLNCVHAVALANLAEMTGNIAIAYSMPSNARFIVSGLSMEYLKKARGTIRAFCTCPIPESNERAEYEVLVELFNSSNELVTRGTLRTLVGPKRG